LLGDINFLRLMVFRLAHNGTPSAAEEGESPSLIGGWNLMNGICREEENSNDAKDIHAMRTCTTI